MSDTHVPDLVVATPTPAPPTELEPDVPPREETHATRHDGTDVEATPEEEDVSDALFALTLLADETQIDRMAADPTGATRALKPLAALIATGFAAHALAMGLFLATRLPLLEAAHHAAAWFIAVTAGFFIAIGAGLPSYWFYGVVARVPAPSWRLAVELLRVQAVGAVVLGAVLPFWLAATLGFTVLGADLANSTTWVGLSHTLPFVAALPGVCGLYRSFVRMRAANDIHGRTSPLLLTAWWVVLFQYTAPITIHALFRAMM